MKVVLTSIIILVVSALLYVEGDHTWSIKIIVPIEKENVAQKMFEHNKHMEFHPFCTSNVLI